MGLPSRLVGQSPLQGPQPRCRGAPVGVRADGSHAQEGKSGMAHFLWGAAGLLISTGIWLWILRRYDRLEPEPLKLLLVVMLLGGLMSVIPAIVFNNLVDHLPGPDGFCQQSLPEGQRTPGPHFGRLHRHQRGDLEVPGHARPGQETAGIRRAPRWHDLRHDRGSRLCRH